MNWKVLINILLIVLLLHFIIKNLQYAYGPEGFANKALHSKLNSPIGLLSYENPGPTEIADIKQRELPQPMGVGSPIGESEQIEGPYHRGPEGGAPMHVDNIPEKDRPVQRVNMDKEHFNAIQFLTTPEDNYDNTYYLNKASDTVKQANVYTNDWNVANFKSNVLDKRNFFKTNPPKTGSQLPHRDLELQEASVSEIGEQRCFNRNNKASAKTVQPDLWKYKNEFPMNGGSFLNLGNGSVYGFEDNDNLFAAFNSADPLVASNCKPNTECQKCPDDIRNGVGIPGRKWWSRN